MDPELRRHRMEQLALELLQEARSGLVLSLRFLDQALYRLEWVLGERPVFGTDARFVYVHPESLLRGFKEEGNRPARWLLHSVMHCILFHPYSGEGKDPRVWNLSCDMAVEHILMQWQIGFCRLSKDREAAEALGTIKKKNAVFTAEYLYQILQKDAPDENTMREWEGLFYQDDHSFWTQAEAWERKEEWRQMSRQVKMDLDTYSKSLALRSEGLVQNLRQVHRERIDYASFLRKFAVLREETRINEDEFDYVYYTYGMKLYGNLPLIEPLEYAEEIRIKDFVIALDTSGSCSGSLIEAFLSKTYSILQNTGSFFRKVNLYIVMSDNKIQQVTHITDSETFETFLRDLRIVGLGGTDFRPVFSYVDQLVEAGHLENLKGLIYFTDGYGRFPAKKPDYDTAFVFLERDSEPKVPSWAIQITLGEEELNR